jgi:ferric-dicitrate binding protein FerR (iron transport regulator)
VPGRRRPRRGGPPSAAVTRERPPRVLWGHDRHGRFRTRASNSVITVRGTIWYVADRCDGTLTRVTSGSVSVRDLRRQRTIVVRAGHGYLARRTG